MGLRVFFARINARFHRRVFLPDGFALQVELGERLEVLIGADVEELLPAFVANLDAVPAPLELLAERADVFAVGIEHEDRRMVLQVGLPFVNHVHAARLVDGHVVRRLPGEPVGQLRPVVLHLVSVLAFADDQRPIGFLGREYGGAPAKAAEPAAAVARNWRRETVLPHG